MLNDYQKLNPLEMLPSWFDQKIDFSKKIFSDDIRFSLNGPDNDTSWPLVEDEPKFRPSRTIGDGSIMFYSLIGSGGFLSIRKIE